MYADGPRWPRWSSRPEHSLSLTVEDLKVAYQRTSICAMCGLKPKLGERVLFVPGSDRIAHETCPL